MQRNQPVAALRRFMILVNNTAGDPAPAYTTFAGANEMLVDKGDGNYVAAGGTLTNARRPLGLANDIVESVDHTTDKMTLTAHGLNTGDGPAQFTTTGALPAGLSLATNYWIVRDGANTIQLAASLFDALDGPTVINFTNPGTGTHTLVLTNAQAPIAGAWIYEATQAETNYRGNYFGLRLAKSGVRTAFQSERLVEGQQQHTGTATAGATGTITLDAGASSTNGYYDDALIVLVGGTGIGQVNVVSSYAGGTKVATMASNWAITPDATSQFVLVPASGASGGGGGWSELGEGSHTYGDMMRLAVSVLAGKMDGFNTSTITAKSLNGAKTRGTWTVDETGRLTFTPGDLT